MFLRLIAASLLASACLAEPVLVPLTFEATTLAKSLNVFVDVEDANSQPQIAYGNDRHTLSSNVPFASVLVDSWFDVTAGVEERLRFTATSWITIPISQIPAGGGSYEAEATSAVSFRLTRRVPLRVLYYLNLGTGLDRDEWEVNADAKLQLYRGGTDGVLLFESATLRDPLLLDPGLYTLTAQTSASAVPPIFPVYGPFDNVSAVGSIDLTLLATPEPASFSLFALSIGMAALYAHRKLRRPMPRRKLP